MTHLINDYALSHRRRCSAISKCKQRTKNRRWNQKRSTRREKVTKSSTNSNKTEHKMAFLRQRMESKSCYKCTSTDRKQQFEKWNMWSSVFRFIATLYLRL
ncbi:hypothetical protein L596_022893 [Steinernema carpocapsae]|uniref:Uncharacterized protein n=1 Tax=Steinernema carpocapsae TaxID=34508 RepID=A0A4U5MBW2_STECR|nr:hypothetical protein L596_022893 [Steinernema carpocapsae]